MQIENVYSHALLGWSGSGKDIEILAPGSLNVTFGNRALADDQN